VATLGLIADWLFAVVMAFISYWGAFILLAFVVIIPLTTELASPSNPIWPQVIIYSGYLPDVAACFVGTISAPNSQRRIACVVVPRPFNVQHLFVSAVSCAIVGGLLYWAWMRRRAGKRGAHASEGQ
jgi:hypothetical protein